jgi:elongation factor 1 alpha-like protein
VPPIRDIAAPLRIPISNVLKRQSAGAAVSGRICGGVVQVGEKLRILPGDESAIVKCMSACCPVIAHICTHICPPLQAIELEEQNVPWAASGSNVTINLTAIDPVHLNIGSVLCPPTDMVPLATIFTARIIVFDIEVPITAGASVSVYFTSLCFLLIDPFVG